MTQNWERIKVSAMDDAPAVEDIQNGVANGKKPLPSYLAPHCIKPGQALNPNGRPKGVHGLARELRRQLPHEKRIEIMKKLVAVACNPEHREWMNAVKLIWDRRDGPIVREMAISGGIPSVSFEVHLNAPGPRTLPALPVANEQRVIDVTPNEPTT